MTKKPPILKRPLNATAKRDKEKEDAFDDFFNEDIDNKLETTKENKPKKGNKNMKSSRKETLKTVVIVILSGVILVAAAYFQGVSQGANAERSKHAEIQAQVKVLSARTVAETPVSK